MRTERLGRGPRYGLRFALLGAGFAAVFLVSFLLGRYGVSLGTLLRILMGICFVGFVVYVVLFTIRSRKEGRQ